MKLMSNCFGYLRHSFESHCGIKFTNMKHMQISFFISGPTSESTVSRRQYRSWFRGFVERPRVTLSPNHSKNFEMVVKIISYLHLYLVIFLYLVSFRHYLHCYICLNLNHSFLKNRIRRYNHSKQRY